MTDRNNTALLRVENLGKRYESGALARAGKKIPALAGVSFSIHAGETLALVGESGSGKSTLALCVACLERPTSGEIWFEGCNIAELSEAEQRRIRPRIQLVFQDPANSLNPRWTAMEIVSEPFIVQRRLDANERREKVHALLERVGIGSERAGHRPDEFSGGQRQRLAIARALALEPKLLILDEALSALDLSVQAQIANLLIELQASLKLTILFITHDLAMAAHLADEIAVMERGEVVEQGAAGKIVRAPEHEATRRLIAAAPSLRRTAHAPQAV